MSGEMKEAKGYYVTIGCKGVDIMQFGFDDEESYDEAIKGFLLGSIKDKQLQCNPRISKDFLGVK